MPSRRQVRRAIELHQADLAAHPKVVGVGTEWDTETRGKGEQKQHKVAIYVSEQPAADASEPDLPSSLEIPARSGVHQISVVVKEIGTVDPEQAGSGQDPGDEFSPDH